MKSPNFVPENIFFRTPFAIALGSVTFVVGFVRLVRLSTQVTRGVIRGETPEQALNRLEAYRRATTLKSMHLN